MLPAVQFGAAASPPSPPGTAWSWGLNDFGQLGDGRPYESHTPGQVGASSAPLTDVSAVAASISHSLALKNDGTVWAWGFNANGRLGDDTTTARSTPVQVVGPGGTGNLTDVIAIAAGDRHSLALKSDGTVWAWGHNDHGQLGNNSSTSTFRTPGQVLTEDLGNPGTFIPLDDITDIAAGGAHNLARRSDGTVWAWGWNSRGQLGNHTDTDSRVAVQVLTEDTGTPGSYVALTNVQDVAAGAEHSLARKGSGASRMVWAWGANAVGQLGANSASLIIDTAVQVVTEDAGNPGSYVPLTDVLAIAAGNYHSLARRADGTAWSWGDNQRGQLGTGLEVFRNVAAPIGGLSDVQAIAGGDYHSLARQGSGAAGTVWAWGYNSNGQLGDGTIQVSTAPVQVLKGGSTSADDFLHDVTTLAGGGSHSLGIRNVGGIKTLWSWGLNSSGQLGDGLPLQRPDPATVGAATALTGVTAVAAGRQHSLALKADGTVLAWGRNSSGQLGDGTLTEHGDPIPVGPSGIPLGNAIAIAAGESHSLALKSDGTVWGWGFNQQGQLGDGTNDDHLLPVQVVGLSGVAAISAGATHSLALKTDGTVWAWGYNYEGELGDGTTDDRNTPVQVTGLGNIVAIDAGGYHNLALSASGNIWVWGYNGDGQLGDGSTDDRHISVQLAGLASVVAVAGGEDHSLAVLSDGTVRAWGTNNGGQLGDGSTDERHIPVTAVGVDSVVDVAAGAGMSLARQANGNVWSWGDNTFGQLGDATSGSRSTPAQIASLADVTAIDAGSYHGLAITVPPVLLTLTIAGSGNVARSPAGYAAGGEIYRYPTGQIVGLTPQPQSGYTFVGWQVNGVSSGWASPLTITLNAPNAIQATFAPTVNFPDVGNGRADFLAITELASRGTIRGYANGNYGPDDGVQRAQMAALIARATSAGPGTPPSTLSPPACLVAGTWDCEDWGNGFSDRNGLDGNLWRNIGALQHYQVAFGYDGVACTDRGVSSPCYGPTDAVTYAQTITFITRMMKAKGYWVAQPGAPNPYANIPGPHIEDVQTYHFYTGGVPAAPGNWNAGATRGWFARALWAALDSQWGQDRTP